MNTLYLFIFETIFLCILILILHRLRKYFGVVLLYAFMGAVQFFQNILASSVYNDIGGGFIVSPGSSIIFTSTLFCLLLIFQTEQIVKSRGIIYGLLFANIIITVLSIITIEQIEIDNNSINTGFLKEIMNFDMILFMTGTCLLFIDTIFLIIIYQFINFKLHKLSLFFKILLPMSLVSLFDSVVFYNVNFFSVQKSENLLVSSIVGKQIAVLIFAIIGFIYLKLIKKEQTINLPKKWSDVISIFTVR
jgi:hypothetical protein